MPHLLSTEGPALAVGDVNGDGLDDMYVGGAKWQTGTLFVQQRDGTFRASAQPSIRRRQPGRGCGRRILRRQWRRRPGSVRRERRKRVHGAGRRAPRPALHQRRTRLIPSRSPSALPTFFENGSCVVPGDFDGDGDIDLFVGSRVVAGKYGLTPRSHLLQNDGKGSSRTSRDELAPGLAEAGMVTSAAWLPHAGGKTLDLVVVGEWMPVRVFRQENGRFVDRTAEAGLTKTEGWWNSVDRRRPQRRRATGPRARQPRPQLISPRGA